MGPKKLSKVQRWAAGPTFQFPYMEEFENPYIVKRLVLPKDEELRMSLEVGSVGHDFGF